MIVVFYAKVVDKRKSGIELVDVYVGGFTESEQEANKLAIECINHVQSGIAIVKIVEVSHGQSLMDTMLTVMNHFDDRIENMNENNQIIYSKQIRKKH